MDDIPDAAVAVCKRVGIVPATLPKAFFFGKEPPAPKLPVAPLADLADEEWAELRKHLPQSQRKNRMDLRNLFNALLWRKTTSTTFTSLPVRYGTHQQVRKGAERLATLGIMSDLLEKLPTLALDPARRRDLEFICREWTRTGERILAKRGHATPA